MGNRNGASNPGIASWSFTRRWQILVCLGLLLICFLGQPWGAAIVVSILVMGSRAFLHGRRFWTIAIVIAIAGGWGGHRFSKWRKQVAANQRNEQQTELWRQILQEFKNRAPQELAKILEQPVLALLQSVRSGNYYPLSGYTKRDEFLRSPGNLDNFSKKLQEEGSFMILSEKVGCRNWLSERLWGASLDQLKAGQIADKLFGCCISYHLELQFPSGNVWQASLYLARETTEGKFLVYDFSLGHVSQNEQLFDEEVEILRRHPIISATK